jgi:hypothetical protein
MGWDAVWTTLLMDDNVVNLFIYTIFTAERRREQRVLN